MRSQNVPYKLMLDIISEVYPKYLQERLLKKLEEKCVISNEQNLLTVTSVSIDVFPSYSFIQLMNDKIFALQNVISLHHLINKHPNEDSFTVLE